MRRQRPAQGRNLIREAGLVHYECIDLRVLQNECMVGSGCQRVQRRVTHAEQKGGSDRADRIQAIAAELCKSVAALEARGTHCCGETRDAFGKRRVRQLLVVVPKRNGIGWIASQGARVQVSHGRAPVQHGVAVHAGRRNHWTENTQTVVEGALFSISGVYGLVRTS